MKGDFASGSLPSRVAMHTRSEAVLSPPLSNAWDRWFFWKSAGSKRMSSKVARNHKRLTCS